MSLPQFTSGPWTRAHLRPNSPSAFIVDFHAAAPWTSVAYSNGHEYTISSPQGKTVKLRVWDPAASSPLANCVRFQPVSAVTGNLGLAMHIWCPGASIPNGAFTTPADHYDSWFSPCSVFIDEPGWGRAAASPQPPGMCGQRSLSCGVFKSYAAGVSECWW